MKKSIFPVYVQVTEEEMFCNDRNSPEFDEFLAILGERVELKNFAGYRGGLDTVNEQTGKTSVYTKYRDRYV